MQETAIQDDWIQKAKHDNLSLFSELDVLLRSLDQFFVVENLPISTDQPNIKNYKPELTAAKDVIVRILGIMEIIIPAHKKNAFWLKKFAEARLLSAMRRGRFREDLLRQDTPEKSIYLLYDTLANIKAIVMDLLKGRTIPIMSYRNVGQLIGKEIRENVHFNPYRRTMDPEIDFIENVKISHVVRTIPDRDVKRTVSIVFLHLFRLLRYLRHIDRSPSQPAMNLHASTMILTLLRTEFAQFCLYVDRAAPRLGDAKLGSLLSTVAYQFRMEMRRVYSQELRDILESKATRLIRGRIQNAHGILNNLIEQCIIQVAQHWDPSLTGDGVFMIFITKAEQSLKLREDLYVLSRLIAHARGSNGAVDPHNFRVRIVRNYMDYFESFTFKLLRYDDYEEFHTLFAAIKAGFEKGDMRVFSDRLHQLGILIGTTVSQVENRSELAGNPLDVEKAESIVRQYVSIS